MKITELADKWRNQTDGYSNVPLARKECADELTAALPKWTRITIHSEPESDTLYMVVRKRKSDLLNRGRFTNPQITPGWCLDVDDYCRPLCDLDYPPEAGS